MGLAILVAENVSSDLGAICLLPSGILLIYGGIRVNFDLKWTYGAQIVNSITISDDIMSIEQLSPPEGGLVNWLRVYFDMPRGKVVDTIHFPLAHIIDVEYTTEAVHDDTYYSLLGTVAVLDENNEIIDGYQLPISPRLRSEKDIEFLYTIIASWINGAKDNEAVQEEQETSAIDFDPSVA
ncbi:MAG: hypothetical protein ACJZ4J_04530 [Candidatus Poseidoniales archaeon]